MWKPCVVSVVLVMAPGLWAADWPNYRGPDYNGISSETNVKITWADDGPNVLWKASIGTGFSSMAAVNGRLYATGNVTIDGQERDVVWCLDTLTGKEQWRQSYPEPLNPNMYEGGPNATPTVHNGHVYTLSRTGKLHCFDAQSGDLKWQKDIITAYRVEAPMWGFSGSPVILDGVIYLNAGTHGLALKTEDGSLVWKNGKGKAGYASVVPHRRGGETELLILSGEEFAWVAPTNGDILGTTEWKTQYAINAADPVVVGDQVFVSSGNNYGCGLLELADGQVKEIYKNKNMKTQLYGSVLYDGHAYGFDGQIGGGGKLTCFDVKTGQPKWQETPEDMGTGTVLLVGDKLIVLGERGKLFVVDATPEGYKELASAPVLDNKCWTVPIIANGLFYARDALGNLVCLDFRG